MSTAIDIPVQRQNGPEQDVSSAGRITLGGGSVLYVIAPCSFLYSIDPLNARTERVLLVGRPEVHIVAHPIVFHYVQFMVMKGRDTDSTNPLEFLGVPNRMAIRCGWQLGVHHHFLYRTPPTPETTRRFFLPLRVC